MKETVAESRKTIGVACFTGLADSEIMWKKYANRENGVRMEFSTNLAPFNQEEKFRDVTYDNNPTILVGDLMHGRASKSIDSLLYTKTEDWNQEDEWRAIHKVAGTAYHYDPASLVSVVIGSQVSNSNRHKIWGALKTKYHIIEQPATGKTSRVHLQLKLITGRTGRAS